ncbi:transporter substrate-binding domain-containing protein [Mycolicibacterium helvum]|uniref:transporter substrate-binding domain-containing protein n=1 Tax=Mycolicibacterium helvum TaxID=1534349 RepID=UPI001FE9CD91|nr:transporter substrate-binding domain-containing protein [Mycolicibacterium helvum]
MALAAILFALMATAPVPLASADPDTDTAAAPVKVAVHPLEPFVMQTSSGELTGFSVDLWNEVAKRLKLTTEFVDTEDVRGQLAAVRDGRADVAIGAISLTYERERSFDFSQPTLDAGLQIIVPVEDTRPAVPGLGGYLELLFSRTMLIWLTAAIVVSVIPAHVFWLIERRRPPADPDEKPKVSRSYYPGVFQAFGWGIGSLVGRQTTQPTSAITKILAIIWGFAGVVFISFYSANLSATLTVTKLAAKISGPADLYDKSVATVAGTTASEFLRGMGIRATETSTIEDCYELLRNEGYEAVVYDAPVLRYYVAHRGEGVAVMAGPVFQEEDLGFVLAINSPLRKPINQALFQMREDGTYSLLKEKWFGDDVATANRA